MYIMTIIVIIIARSITSLLNQMLYGIRKFTSFQRAHYLTPVFLTR